MRFSLFVCVIALLLTLGEAVIEISLASDYQPTSYAPIAVECSADIQLVRPPNGLSDQEAHWVYHRKQVALRAFHGYLERLNLEDFDVEKYVEELRHLNYHKMPTIGLAISGGGYRSGFSGTAAIRALDSRLDAANDQRIGGLLQSMTYISGQSGGSWPVTSFASYDFPTADEILQDWTPWISAFGTSGNSSHVANPVSVFEDIGKKLKAGFNVSTTDFFGRTYGYEFLPGPNGGVNNTWSGVTRLSKFINHEMPYPMLQANTLSADDQEFFGLQVPHANATSYEITPFEVGSWTVGFTPTQWLGTRLDEGAPVNISACTIGFDSTSFMMGSAASAFNFWVIEDETNGTLAQFSKRSLSYSNAKPLSKRITLFPQFELNELEQAFNSTFNLSTSDISHAIWPNPFYNSSSSTPKDITLIDATEIGQAIPLWSQIQPARNPAFIIAWEDNPDSIPYQWQNGTNLYNAYLAANASGLPFPIIPPVNTILNLNMTTRPIFFGCDSKLTTTNSTDSPIILYMANAPYSAYTNYSWTQTSFSQPQMYEIFDNGFNALSQGNGTLDAEWPECLGCAAIERSLEAVGIESTAQCERCFERYCWDGSLDESTPRVLDPVLKLEEGLGFEDWNATSWI